MDDRIMRLYLAAAIGRGSTELSAFDAALVGAGVGWCQDGGTGNGLFVEHRGFREQDVRDQIVASLRDLQAVRELDLGPVQTRVVGAMCSGAATCALVICSYGTEAWPMPTRYEREACERSWR